MRCETSCTKNSTSVRDTWLRARVTRLANGTVKSWNREIATEIVAENRVLLPQRFLRLVVLPRLRPLQDMLQCIMFRGTVSRKGVTRKVGLF